jgi:hypothetical protein
LEINGKAKCVNPIALVGRVGQRKARQGVVANRAQTSLNHRALIFGRYFLYISQHKKELKINLIISINTGRSVS